MSDESKRSQFNRWWSQFGRDTMEPSHAAWIGWLERDRLAEVAAAPEARLSKEHEERAAALFLAYVCYNYPPRTIIAEPAWHAPKLFRAALRALKDGSLPPPMNRGGEKR